MKRNKALKAEYKNRKFPIGVYQIRNLINGKIFVGSSTNLTAIWNRLKFELNMGSHSNTDLQADWKKEGADNFIYEILSEIKQEDDQVMDHTRAIKELETLYLEELQPFGEKGYHKQ